MNIVMANGQAAVSYREENLYPVTIKTKTNPNQTLTLAEARALQDLLTATLALLPKEVQP